MISIDFVAGSHGKFLEFVCNKFIVKINIDYSPFNHLGASHALFPKGYLPNKVFYARHYSELKIPLSDRVIRITFTPDDLLSLSSGAFLRAGDSNIQEEHLDIDTYYKLKNSFFSELIELINHAYPEVRLSETNPDCPRHVLREFFKFGFKHPENNGFTHKLNELVYPLGHDVFDFPYKNFYNKELFVTSIESIAQWFNNGDVDTNEVSSLWTDFYARQRHKDLKSQCDIIIDAVLNLKDCDIENLTILQESYINGILEDRFGKEMPFNQPIYFKTTNEIIRYLCLK